MWDGKSNDGSPINGLVIECTECGLEKHVTYLEWAQIEKEGRAEVKGSTKRPSWFRPVSSAMGQKGVEQYPLWVYVVGVLVVLGIINLIAHLAVFSAGFLIGMLAMYIAVHFYRYK